jgi:hypothetical protein
MVDRLEYQKDGQSVRLRALHDSIEQGQQVILFNVTLSDGDPLSMYVQPAAFRVVSTSTHREGSLVLLDDDGNSVTTTMSKASWLYDTTNWGLFQYARQQELLRRKDRKIEQLDGHLSLLKDILIKQGVRVITAEQAAATGLQ